MEVKDKKLQHYFFLALLLGVLVLLFYVMRPFLSALVLAFTLSIIFRPLYTRLHRRFGGNGSLASLVTVSVVIVAVLIPFILIGSLLFGEARDTYLALSANGGGPSVVNKVTTSFQHYLNRFVPAATIDAGVYIQYGLQWIVSHLDSLFSKFFQIILTIFIMMIAIFYLLRDGLKLRERYIFLSPLSDSYDETILDRISTSISSVVKGSLVIAVVQGVLAAIGVSFAGLPNPLIWGLLATIGSLIPGLGTAVVIGPAIIYLFVIKDLPHAFVLLAWQLLVVGLVDNFMAPYLMKRGMKVHPFLILLSVLGGIAYFGPIGFILGPVILAFFSALLDIYPLIISRN